MESKQPTGDSGEARTSEWDDLTDFDSIMEREKVERTEKLTTLGQEYRQLERDFREEFAEKRNKFADDEEKQAEYNVFILKKFEGRVRHNRFLSALHGESMDPYELAKIDGAHLGMNEIENSIEVKSGDYYGARMKSLREAIEGSDIEEEEKKADRDRMAETLDLVLSHVEFEFQQPQDSFESKMWDINKTEMHNKVIDQLNWLNEIAEKYGTERFTCRDFVTSRGHSPGRDHDVGGAMGRKMLSDRAIVKQYFNVAYKERVAGLRRKLERDYFY